jgi:hypothetical protein
LYASSGGTTQLFAMHLVEQLQQQQQQNDDDDSQSSTSMRIVSLESLADYPTLESMLLLNSFSHHGDDAATLSQPPPPPLYILLLPTAGVGEPPGMAKKWYESLMSSVPVQQPADVTTLAAAATTSLAKDQPPLLEYAIFGLGNSLGKSSMLAISPVCGVFLASCSHSLMSLSLSLSLKCT